MTKPSAEAQKTAQQARERALQIWNDADNPRLDLDDYIDEQVALALDAAYRRGIEAASKPALFLIEEIVDLEGREGITDYDFAEQVIALAQTTREHIRALAPPQEGKS